MRAPVRPPPTISPRRLASLVHLTGSRLKGYRVVVNGFDGCMDFMVPSQRVGWAIVKAIREIAKDRPYLFPPSRREERGS